MSHVHQGKLGNGIKGGLIVALVSCIAIIAVISTSKVHTYSPDVQQKAQFNALNAAIELFNNEFDGYPPSSPNDPTGQPYGAVLKLAEALVGPDLLGFHSSSIFRRDGLDASGTLLYPHPEDLSITPPQSNLIARKGPFLQTENANARRLVDIYGKGKTDPFPEDTFVLCDIYERRRPSGEKTGMPILYYRADSLSSAHDVANPDNPQNIYHYQDNQALLALGVPGKPGETHPLADPKRFYLNTQSLLVSSTPRPYRADTFILIRAGLDGLYGTADDICNFEWKYRKN